MLLEPPRRVETIERLERRLETRRRSGRSWACCSVSMARDRG